jgi:biotin operon repressor
MQLARSQAPTDRSPSRRRQEGAVTLLPNRLRALWTDALALDRDLPDWAVRVGMVIGGCFNRETGEWHLTREWIAAALGCNVTKVWRAVTLLEERGYLIVKRRELGQRKSDGRRVAGGKGMASTYAPGLDGRQVTAMTHHEVLPGRVKQLKENIRPNGKGPKQCKNALLGDPPDEGQSSASVTPKECTDALPTLKEPSVPNPMSSSGADVHHEAPGASTPETSWLRISHRLEARLGKQDMEIWFRGVSIIAISDVSIRLRAPSLFVRDWIINHWRDALLACCRAEHRSVLELEWSVGQ